MPRTFDNVGAGRVLLQYADTDAIKNICKQFLTGQNRHATDVDFKRSGAASQVRTVVTALSGRDIPEEVLQEFMQMLYYKFRYEEKFNNLSLL